MNNISNITESIGLNGFEYIDFLIWTAYLILIISVSAYISKKRDGRDRTTKDYFLANNTLPWWVVGCTLIASNISTEQIIGEAGTCYSIGFATAAYELIAAIAILVIAKYFLPIMLSQKLTTIPELLSKRYNKGIGLGFSILWLLMFIFINLTSVAWLGALAIEQILGLQGCVFTVFGLEMSIRTAIICILFFFSALYSIHGGMMAISWTSVMQVAFIILGGLITSYFTLTAVAGENGTYIDGLNKVYNYLTTGQYANDTHFDLIVRKSCSPEGYNLLPGLGAVVGGMLITNFCYWGFTQYIIQGGLSAETTKEARKGLVFAALIKLVIPFIVLIPGVCAFYMTHYQFTSADFANAISTPDQAMPWFIANMIPTGIKGLFFATLTASIISTIAAISNSASTIFTLDIYKKYWETDATDKKLVTVGKLSAAVAILIALFAVRPLIGSMENGFKYIQEYSSFIYPGVMTLMIFGFFWKRASTFAAATVAIITVPLGIIFQFTLSDVPFLFRSSYVFIIDTILFIAISYLSHQRTKINLPSKSDRRKMVRWGYIIGVVSLGCILAAATVTIGNAMLPPDVSPEENIFAYLNDIGFQTFYFVGCLMATISLCLIASAKDRKSNVKAFAFDMELIETDKKFAVYATIICLYISMAYIIFW